MGNPSQVLETWTSRHDMNYIQSMKGKSVGVGIRNELHEYVAYGSELDEMT